jgi:hypothetical protein
MQGPPPLMSGFDHAVPLFSAHTGSDFMSRLQQQQQALEEPRDI